MLHRRRSRRHLRERLIFFSDAVVAIAMTLLGIDLPLPHGETKAQVWHSFVELLPGEYLTFVIGFAVTALFWMHHRQLFRRVHVIDPTLRRLNMLCLFFIVVTPFATKVDVVDSHFVLGPVLYAVVIAALALVVAAMAAHADRAGPVHPRTRLRTQDARHRHRRFHRGRGLPAVHSGELREHLGGPVCLAADGGVLVADRVTERRARAAVPAG
ncbi:TMEM175 family protein [Amycolatopsis sp. NBC_01480]|uniref:TMEM175 family protein n=1 Tax=Amycolatopsis sp. NBC_01480 TaxID=2903562 RepID=UPI002E2E605E|nr:TMEM175 family protein [Amycolatopsis sp. NBC_01480]